VIWGALVPYGAVWRTGADYPTRVELSEALVVEGQPLAAGRYALYTIPGRDSWTVIFSRNTELWGAYGYHAADDALRVEVTPRAAAFTEAFTIEFEKVTSFSATLLLRWEELAVPVELRADVVGGVMATVSEAPEPGWGLLWRAAVALAETGERSDLVSQWLERSLALERNWMNLWTAAEHAASSDRRRAVALGEEALAACEAQAEYCPYTRTYRLALASWRASGEEVQKDGGLRSTVPDCPPLPGGAEALTEPGGFVLVGEVHGTVEAPAFFAALACAAARRAGTRGIVVGVEMPRSDQATLDAFFARELSEAAEAAEDARAFLLSADHFTDEWRDGRDSEAMVTLLEDLHRWRRGGLPIATVAFDVAAGERVGGAAREAAMAERIAGAAASHPGATVLVHSGNLHTRVDEGVPWDPKLVPMGALLRGRFPGLHALDFASSGGSTRACLSEPGESEPRCGEHRQGGPDRGDQPFVELWSEPGENGHLGIYYLGPISASPPAGASRR
jgi:hypothetical protein